MAVLGPLLDQRVCPSLPASTPPPSTAAPPRSAAAVRISRHPSWPPPCDAEELWIWTDVDGIMTGDPRLIPTPACSTNHLQRSRRTSVQRRQSAAPAHARAARSKARFPVWSKNSFAPEKPGTRIVRRSDRAAIAGARAVTSMTEVALVPSSPPAPGSAARASWPARSMPSPRQRRNARITSSSYRQRFCFLVRQHEVKAALEAME